MPRATRPTRPTADNATRGETAEQQVEAERLLHQLLERIDALTRLDDDGYFEVEGRSSLGLDNHAVYPLAMTSTATWCLLSSIDHLITVATIARTGTLPMVALVSLLRSTIETACVAIYFLAPDSRETRVLRLLQDEHAQIKDAERAQSDFGNEQFGEAARADLIRRAHQGFPTAGTWNEVVQGAATITKKITLACPVIEASSSRNRAEFAIRGTWRAFSGATHGRTYAIQTILDREELGTTKIPGL